MVNELTHICKHVGNGMSVSLFRKSLKGLCRNALEGWTMTGNLGGEMGERKAGRFNHEPMRVKHLSLYYKVSTRKWKRDVS